MLLKILHKRGELLSRPLEQVFMLSFHDFKLFDP